MIFGLRPALVAILVFGTTVVLAEAQVFASIEEIAVPSKGEVEQPSLVALPDGRLAMTWTELSGPTYAEVWFALRDETGWTEPVSLAKGDDLFVNYADFPTAVGLSDGTIAAHWLRMNGDSSYAYDVNIALSSDGGATWGPPVVPHQDGSARQHGFVSLLPDGPGGVLAMWLDGRNYDTTDAFGGGDPNANAMQLRATTLNQQPAVSQDRLLDDRTCSCCQTSATIAAEGTVILAYRDRTADEIRDISVVRRVDGLWTDPMPVSGDGWEISGCPVNGPAVDALGDDATLAWFTAADGIPAVKIAFSDDRAKSFGAPQRIDLGGAVGQVDLLQLADGSALVSWVEITTDGEALLVCRATSASGCSGPVAITVNPAGRTIGFPRMAMADGKVYIAWSEPARDELGKTDGRPTIRAAVATLEPVK